MQITNNRYLTDILYSSYRQNQTGKPDETLFAQLVQQAKPTGSTGDALGNGQYLQPGPATQVWMDYLDWKSQQPPRDLPDSQGDTPENRAYLEEHYCGELTLFQRLDAADTMADMGVISREEMLNAIGLGPKSLWVADTSVKIVSCGTPANARYMAPWSQFFTDAPIMQTDSLSGIWDLIKAHLARLAELAKQKEEDEAAAQHVQDMLNVLTQVRPA